MAASASPAMGNGVELDSALVCAQCSRSHRGPWMGPPRDASEHIILHFHKPRNGTRIAFEVEEMRESRIGASGRSAHSTRYSAEQGRCLRFSR